MTKIQIGKRLTEVGSTEIAEVLVSLKTLSVFRELATPLKDGLYRLRSAQSASRIFWKKESASPTA